MNNTNDSVKKGSFEMNKELRPVCRRDSTDLVMDPSTLVDHNAMRK